jgi:hypothetical protein
MGKLEGRRPLGTARLRWEANTKMDLKEISLEDMHRINLAQDIECDNELSGSIT